MIAPNAIRRILSSNPLFEGLQQKDLDSICSLCRVKRYVDGDKIIQEGQFGDNLFIVISGSVEIVKVAPNGFEERIALLNASDTFGEVSLIDDESRSATVIAQGRCKVIRLARTDIEALPCVNAIYKNMARMLTNKLRKANQSLVSLMHVGDMLQEKAKTPGKPLAVAKERDEEQDFDPDIFGVDGEDFSGKETLLGKLSRYYAAFKTAYPDLDLWDLGSWELIAEDPYNPPGHRRDAGSYLTPLEAAAKHMQVDKQALHEELMKSLFH